MTLTVVHSILLNMGGFVFSLWTIEVYDGKIGFIEIILSNEGYQIRTKLKENRIFYQLKDALAK